MGFFPPPQETFHLDYQNNLDFEEKKENLLNFLKDLHMSILFHCHLVDTVNIHSRVFAL